MIVWNDVSSWSRTETDRSQPKTWQAKVGVFRLLVHRHVHYPPDIWLATCHPDLFSQVELESKNADDAKLEAVKKLRACCEDAIEAMNGKRQKELL